MYCVFNICIYVLLDMYVYHCTFSSKIACTKCFIVVFYSIDQLDVIRTRRGRAAMPVTNVRYIQNGNATVNSLQPLLFSNSGNFESTVEHTGTDSAYEEIPANSSEAMYEGILEHTDSTGTTWSNTSTTNEIDPQEYSYPLSANDYEGIVRQSDGAGQVWCNQGAMEAMHIYEGLDQYQTMDDSNEEPLSLEQIYTFVPSNVSEQATLENTATEATFIIYFYI